MGEEEWLLTGPAPGSQVLASGSLSLGTPGRTTDQSNDVDLAEVVQSVITKASSTLKTTACGDY